MLITNENFNFKMIANNLQFNTMENNYKSDGYNKIEQMKVNFHHNLSLPFQLISCKCKKLFIIHKTFFIE